MDFKDMPADFQLVLENCTFSHIRSFQRGGDFKIGDTSLSGGSKNYNAKTALTIIKCTFEDNYSPLQGGALTFIAVRPLEIVDCIFRNNTGNGGGALYIQCYFDSGLPDYDRFLPNCTIINCTFINNNCTSSSQPYTIFLNNLGQVASETNVMISNCTFQDNLLNRGYCIYSGINSITVEGSIFDNLYQENSCGNIQIRSRSGVNIDSCQFTKSTLNSILYQPIYGTQGNEHIAIRNCKFDNASSNTDWVSIRIATAINDAVLENLTFSNHDTDKCIFYVRFLSIKPNLILKGLTFTNNYYHGTTQCGGSGINIVNVNKLIFDGCTFELNHSPGNGGSINIINKDLAFIDCKFKNNYSPSSNSKGGACYFRGPQNIKITGCAFDSNEAQLSGGAICLETNLRSFILNDCIFINCSASERSFISYN